MSKATDKCQPFLKYLKKTNSFERTDDCEKAFQEMKVTTKTRMEKKTMIAQSVSVVKESERHDWLQRLLSPDDDEGNGIVFVNTQKKADRVVKRLAKFRFQVTSFHAGKSQVKWKTSLREFGARMSTILVAINVVA